MFKMRYKRFEFGFLKAASDVVSTSFIFVKKLKNLSSMRFLYFIAVRISPDIPIVYRSGMKSMKYEKHEIAYLHGTKLTFVQVSTNSTQHTPQNSIPYSIQRFLKQQIMFQYRDLLKRKKNQSVYVLRKCTKIDFVLHFWKMKQF